MKKLVHTALLTQVIGYHSNYAQQAACQFGIPALENPAGTLMAGSLAAFTKVAKIAAACGPTTWSAIDPGYGRSTLHSIAAEAGVSNTSQESNTFDICDRKSKRASMADSYELSLIPWPLSANADIAGVTLFASSLLKLESKPKRFAELRVFQIDSHPRSPLHHRCAAKVRESFSLAEY